jgi:hypothetical protein
VYLGKRGRQSDTKSEDVTALGRREHAAAEDIGSMTKVNSLVWAALFAFAVEHDGPRWGRRVAVLAGQVICEMVRVSAGGTAP